MKTENTQQINFKVPSFDSWFVESQQPCIITPSSYKCYWTRPKPPGSTILTGCSALELRKFELESVFGATQS